jgi:hemerythrin
MDFVTWTGGMSVGVDVLDADHRRLLDIFNALLHSSVASANVQELAGLLDELEDYTHVHFGREEGMMAAAGYPDLDAHQKAHAYFIGQVAVLRSELREDLAAMLYIDLILLLKEWFIEHIQTVDKQYQAALVAAPPPA